MNGTLPLINMPLLDILKLYPNKTGFFVGIAIGLTAYILSTSFCVFDDSKCATGNPFFPLAMFLGAALLGIYCGWLVNSNIILKFFVMLIITFLTTLAVLLSGARGIIDQILGGESIFSHALLFGVLSQVFASVISILTPPPQNTNN